MEPAPNHDDTPESRPPEASARRRSTVSVVAVVLFIIAITTTLALLSRETGQPPSDAAGSGDVPPEIVRGVACADLREAATQLAADDQEGFVAAIERAGREAEDALQRDGVVFGKPERLALELVSLVTGDGDTPAARVRDLISRGIGACPSRGDA